MSFPESAVAIPKEFQCVVPPGLPSGISRQTHVVLPISQINSSTGSVVTLRTPIVANGWIDPKSVYVRVNATLNGATPSSPTPAENTTGGFILGKFAALSMFSRYTVLYASSTVVEDVLQPGIIANAWANTSLNTADIFGSSAMGIGNQNLPYTNLGPQLVGVNSDAAVVNNNLWQQTVDVCSPLIGLFGPATSQFIPAYLSDFALSFYLDDPNNYLCMLTGYTCTNLVINNIELYFDVVTLPQEAQNAALAASGGRLVLTANQFTQSSYLIPASTGPGTYNFPLNLNRMSALACWILCNLGQVSANTLSLSDGIYGSVLPNPTQGTCIILNGTPTPPQGLSPAIKPSANFAALQSCQRSLSSAGFYGVACKDAFYRASSAVGQLIAYNSTANVNSSTANIAQANMSMMVIDLSRFSRSGSYLSGSPMSYSSLFQLNTTGTLAAITHNLLIYTEFSAVIVFDLATRQCSRMI
jgi:hypothetical protein